MSKQIPENRVAVVTGASSGFGAQIVRNLAAEGWLTIGIARREDRLQALSEEVGGEYEVCDVSQWSDIGEAAGNILERHSSINLLVNNAGMAMRDRVIDAADLADADEVIDTNYKGTLWMTAALLNGLAEAAPDATVVNMVSAAANIPNPNSGIYSASKAAQLSLSHSLTTDLRPLGIRVQAILPGKAHTEGHPQTKKSSPLSGIFGTDVDTVARKVVNGVGDRSKVVYIPRALKPVAVLHEIAPVITTRIVEKLIS